MTEKYKSQEEIKKVVNSAKDIDPSKIIVFKDFVHDGSYHVTQFEWKNVEGSKIPLYLSRESSYHTHNKKDAIETCKLYNKWAKENNNKWWYEVTFGYPFYDQILRTWAKHAKTKEIPFDAKIRIIIYE